MTYRKIAQLAGVSLSTVSKVLSGSSEISRETSERILRIAEENNVARPKYRRNRSTLRIAIIVPEIVSVTYSYRASALVEELRKSGIEPYIYLCGFSPERYFDLVDRLYDEGMTDGILSFANCSTPQKPSIPTVEPCSSKTGSYNDMIYADIESGIFDALEYLMSLGHSKIGFISEKNTFVKLENFRSSAARLGLPVLPEYIYVSNKRFEEIGCDAAEYYMKLPEMPTALIAAYDEIALGALHTFTENGIKVPDEVSIIGINDIPSSTYANIPLTTIRTYKSEVTTLAVKLLLDKIKNPKSHMTQHISVKCGLIIRNTTAKAKTQKETII